MNTGAVMAGFIAMGCLLLLALAAAAYSWDWALRTAALGRQAAVDAGRARELSMSVATAHYSGGRHQVDAPTMPPLCCTLCLSPDGHGGLVPRETGAGRSWQCRDLGACLAAAQRHVLVLGGAS